AVRGADVGGHDERAVEHAQQALVLLVARRPVLTVGTVPLPRLAGVGGVHREREGIDRDHVLSVTGDPARVLRSVSRPSQAEGPAASPPVAPPVTASFSRPPWRPTRPRP